MNLPPAEQVLADAAEYLIKKGQSEAARVLLSCSLYLKEVPDYKPEPDEEWWGWDGGVDVYLVGPDDIRRIISSFETPTHPLSPIIQEALQYSIGLSLKLQGVYAHPGVNVFDPTWRSQLLERAHETEVQEPKVDNQGSDDFGSRILTWNGLRFRSESERQIAAALEKAGVLFLANCRARLGPPDKRQNREGDFLICHEGKWGVLEVDGAPFHPPSRKAQEDERDRLFKQHGVRVVEHFDAKKCYETPIEVVKQFLAILKQS